MSQLFSALPPSLTRPVPAAEIANEFLWLGELEKDVPPIDQMKLQKLVFYAHAWHLGYGHGPLIEENIEAWPWGPVVRPIYFQTSRFGKNPVGSFITTLDRDNGASTLSAKFVERRLSDNSRKEFVKNVWSTHKQYSGIQLSNSTHGPGEPWTIIKETFGSLEEKPIIPNWIIEDVFKRKVESLRG